MRNLIGSLPSQIIREMIAAGYLLHGSEANIQPASLDLSITDTVYRMKGTFLPRPGEKIDDFFSKGALYKASLDYPLELNGIYLIKLREKCNLPEDIYAYTNNKSTTGRINLQTRLIANGVSQFDHIPKGYKGDIWLEVVPKSFPIKLHAGAKLNQIRFFNGDTRLNRLELEMIYDQYQILFNKNGSPVPKQERYFMDNGITMTVDLDSEIAGYKCIPSTNKYLDFKKEEELNPTDFFEPITRPKTGELYLKRDEFYILFTKEYLRVPPTFAGEMVAYDPSKGEYRSHYAGFFDPGFGYGKDGSVKGRPGVLEVFTHDNDFILRDEQPICKMVFEKVLEIPDIIYGTDSAGSHYSAQLGPKLSRHFNMKQYESIYQKAR